MKKQKIAFYKKDGFIYTVSFLIPAGIGMILCCLIKICPFGNNTFLFNDSNKVLSDFLAYFRDIQKYENDLIYTFSRNSGTQMQELYSTFLGNPLNMITKFFTSSNLPIAITILTWIQAGLSGLCCCCYFRNQSHTGYLAVIYSSIYAVISFISALTQDTFLFDAAVFLPLVMLGIDRIIKKSTSRVYVYSLFGILYINLFAAVMIGIIGIPYFCIRLMSSENWRNRKYREQTLLKYIVGTLLPIGMAAFMIFPSQHILKHSIPFIFKNSLLYTFFIVISAFWLIPQSGNNYQKLFFCCLFSIISILLFVVQIHFLQVDISKSISQNEMISLTDYKNHQSTMDYLLDKIRTNDPSFFRIENNASLTKDEAFHFSYNVDKYNSTITSKSISGIKYFISSGNDSLTSFENLFSKDNLSVIQNPYTFPICFLVSDSITNLNVEKQKPLVGQNMIITSLLGETNNPVFTQAKAIQSISADTYKWEVKGQDNSIIYAEFAQPVTTTTDFIYSINGKEFNHLISEETNVIIPLGSFKEGETAEFSVKLSNSSQYLIHPSFYYENLNQLDQTIKTINTRKATFIRVSSSHFIGSFYAPADNQYLLFSIPFDNGWKIQIDGKNTQKVPISEGFTAIKVSKGKHEIILQYIPDGLVCGAIISYISWLLLAVIAFFPQITVYLFDKKPDN